MRSKSRNTQLAIITKSATIDRNTRLRSSRPTMWLFWWARGCFDTMERFSFAISYLISWSVIKASVIMKWFLAVGLVNVDSNTLVIRIDTCCFISLSQIVYLCNCTMLTRWSLFVVQDVFMFLRVMLKWTVFWGGSILRSIASKPIWDGWMIQRSYRLCSFGLDSLSLWDINRFQRF